MLVKEGKNHVAWNENPPETAAKLDDGSGKGEIGSPPRINKTTQVQSTAELEDMKKHLEKLKAEERQLDKYLEYLNKQAAVFNGQQPVTSEQAAYLPDGVQNVAEHMYVRFKDITAMSQYSEDTVIGIRAPSGTSLEVPDPDQGMHPGSRRYEMYLSSKGAEGTQAEGGKGDPINVYLVRPQADKAGKTGEADGKQGQFVQHTSPAKRGKGEASREQDGQQPEVAETRRHPPAEGFPPHSYQKHQEWGPPERHYQHRPPYPPAEGRHYPGYRKEAYGPPPPGYHPSGGPPQYYDPAWGPPPPGYNQHPHHHHPRQASSSRAPPPQKPSSRKDDPSKQLPADHSKAPPAAGGPPRDVRGSNPFRPRAHQYHPSHELSTSSSGGDRDSAPFRPPTPVRDQQSSLMALPLQSPNGDGSFGMPSSFYPSPYDTPPGAPSNREQTHAHAHGSQPQFPPMPPLGREGSREGYRDDRWHPPRSSASRGSGGEGGSQPPDDSAGPSAAV